MAETETVRLLPPLLPARRERLEARISLVILSAASDVPLVVLSEFERGIRQLNPEQESRRRAALARLASRREAGG
jgi:hypothetical protein